MSKFWWTKKWDNKICGITHTRLRPGTNNYGVKYTTTLVCGHSFYTKPLTEWVETCIRTFKDPSCPICRETIMHL